MSEARACPECQAELPSDAPEELCPKCLLHVALSDSDQGLADAGLIRRADYARTDALP